MPSADRVHIGIFGRRNAGKSSIINAITGQNLAIVSDVLGTTTDPVPKAMELLPLGPVVIIDTPGLDDIGELGELRVKKAYQILNKTDIAVLVIDASLGMTPEDLSILKKIQDKKIPYVVVKNKSDLCSSAENGAVCPNLDSMSDASFHIDASNSIEVMVSEGDISLPEKAEKPSVLGKLAAAKLDAKESGQPVRQGEKYQSEERSSL